MKYILSFLSVCTLCFEAQGGLRLHKPHEVLKQALQKYSKRGAEVAFKKTYQNSLLKTKRVSGGQLFIKGKNFRISFSSKLKKHIFYNSTGLWIIETKNKNLKISHLKESGFSLFPIGMLFSKNTNLSKYFKIQKTHIKNGHRFTLIPRASRARETFKKIVVEIGSKKTISQLFYEDSLSNNTKYQFLSSKFSIPFTKNFFIYSPPKGSKVHSL